MEPKITWNENINLESLFDFFPQNLQQKLPFKSYSIVFGSVLWIRIRIQELPGSTHANIG